MNIIVKDATSDISILRVDSRTFAEILGKSDTHYKLNVKFHLLTNSNKNIFDYDRVKITISRKETEEQSKSSGANNVVSSTSRGTPNPGFNPNSVKPVEGQISPSASQRLYDKITKGVSLIKSSKRREVFLDQKTVNVAPSIRSHVSNSYYDLTVIDLPEIKTQTTIVDSQSLPVARDNVSNSVLSFSVKTTLDKINKNRCSVTEPISNPQVLSLSSASDLDGPEIRKKLSEKSSFYYDLVKYYLDEVPSSPNETNYPFYSVKKSSQKVEEIEVYQDFLVMNDNKTSELSVKFELYKIGQITADETITVSLKFNDHVQAFEAIKIPPVVKIKESIPMLGMKSGLSTHKIEVLDSESRGKVSKFNVYEKRVLRNGEVTPYKFITAIPNDGRNSFDHVVYSDLSVIRVVPVDFNSIESSVFTDTVVGKGHRSIDNLVILTRHRGGSVVVIEARNLPQNSKSISLYRRACKDKEVDSQSQFQVLYTYKLDSYNTSVFSIEDKFTEWDTVYEYYVVVSSINDSNVETSTFSNFSIIKTPATNAPEKAVTVEVTNFKMLSTNVSTDVSFDIKTTISQSENQRITESLKSQLGELYEQYLSPSNSSSSPLGDKNGVPQYSDIFYHEIVRTDINTGVKETFDLVTDGTFNDDITSRRTSNVSPLRVSHSYIYQIFTFKKNPIELFKRYVATGTAVNGRSWFYRPYKWMLPKATSGRLYPDDSDGIPIVDSYEAFTSEAYGETASYTTASRSRLTSFTRISSNRVDRNTVKVEWQLAVSEDPYGIDSHDSFVVMKVVNGTRSFVGVTHLQYIYHELTNRDLGSVYYIVVPIMSDFSIDLPGYTDYFVVEPDGLTEKTRSMKTSAD